MSGPSFPWLRMTIVTAGLLGLGYGLMRATVPTPEQTYQAMAPDLRRKVDANRAARLARENATNAQATAQLNDPDSETPVWADASRKS
ncbi:Assembly factor CBP4 [Sparassis crispa]|uniref:Assembly factor CBP4 n=1 Tax=Sparassis crispa TaxID=139825 RepID=A0A401GJU8_9APHY|nr:Assembly factor CBP4 [Sparassis crispa]GBE82441.1 Assembly factor CBP4 [Sparassis crispa]